MAEHDKRMTNGTIDEACREAFAIEDGYVREATGTARYRVFRDGYFAGWIASQKHTAVVLAERMKTHD